MPVSDVTTKLAALLDPQVLADMISAKLPDRLVVMPFAKIDSTLVGQPGSTITVPRYHFIGYAEDVAEGEDVPVVELTQDDVEATGKKAGKGVRLTDEAVLSAYGDPVGETVNQLTLSIAGKIDNDALAALYEGTQKIDIGAVISYEGVVDAIDLFHEEEQSDKVMFVNPKQTTSLRKDPLFQNKNTYGSEVVMRGEIGQIAGVRIVPTRKVVLVEGEDGAPDTYVNPIIKLTNDAITEADIPAITIYDKRSVVIESGRNIRNKTTEIIVDKHYVASLSNDSNVVLATFLAEEPEEPAEG